MFCHFVYAVNEIWYPGRATIDRLRYQIVLAYTKWENSQHLKLSLIKLLCRKSYYLLHQYPNLTHKQTDTPSGNLDPNNHKSYSLLHQIFQPYYTQTNICPPSGHLDPSDYKSNIAEYWYRQLHCL